MFTETVETNSVFIETITYIVNSNKTYGKFYKTRVRLTEIHESIKSRKNSINIIGTGISNADSVLLSQHIIYYHNNDKKKILNNDHYFQT